jgi:hypothetical protein
LPGVGAQDICEVGDVVCRFRKRLRLLSAGERGGEQEEGKKEDGSRSEGQVPIIAGVGVRARPFFSSWAIGHRVTMFVFRNLV